MVAIPSDGPARTGLETLPSLQNLRAEFVPHDLRALRIHEAAKTRTVQQIAQVRGMVLGMEIATANPTCERLHH